MLLLNNIPHCICKLGYLNILNIENHNLHKFALINQLRIDAIMAIKFQGLQNLTGLEKPENIHRHRFYYRIVYIAQPNTVLVLGLERNIQWRCVVCRVGSTKIMLVVQHVLSVTVLLSKMLFQRCYNLQYTVGETGFKLQSNTGYRPC